MSDDGERTDRRTVLQAIGAAGAFGLAGCVGDGSGSEDPGTGTDDPTPTETGTPTATPTGTETTTSTPTRTTASGPKPTASVQVEEDGDELTVLLVSLGVDADRVELGGCGGGEVLPGVGERATVSGCDGADPLRIFAVDDDDGRRALVRRYPRESDSGGGGGACDGDGDGGTPTAGFSIDSNPVGGADTEVTLNSLGENTRGIELRGCADFERVTKIGATATVTLCEEGEVLEVIGVGCDGETALLQEFEVRDTGPETTTQTQNLYSTVDVQRVGDDFRVTLEDSKDAAEVRLEGCADGQVLSEAGQSVTLSNCSRGDTIRAVPVGPDGDEGPSQTVRLADDPPVPSEVGLQLYQDASELTVVATDIGVNVTGIEVGGCADRTVLGQGESTTVSDCEGLVRLTANHAEAQSVVIAEFSSETTVNGTLPTVGLQIVRNGSRAGVVTTDTGDAVGSVDVGGCGGDLGGNGTATSSSCGKDERVTISVETEG